MLSITNNKSDLVTDNKTTINMNNLSSTTENIKSTKRIRVKKNVKNNSKHTKTTSKKKVSKNVDNFINDVEKYIEQPWSIIESYFDGQHLKRMVRHQIESYNDFVNNQIKKTINMFNNYLVRSERDYDEKTNKYGLEMYISFENFHIYRPQTFENNGATRFMFPQEARIRNFTYASTMTIDINFKIIRRTGELLDNVSTHYKKLSNIHIGKLPIMLKSSICILNQYKHMDNSVTGECKFDAGGYFIINGSEKTILAQERAAENQVYCFPMKGKKFSWTAEIYSAPDFKIISPKHIKMMVLNQNNGFGNPIHIQIPRMKQAIPLFVVFRALGIISDKDIISYILLDDKLDKNKQKLFMLRGSIVDSNDILTQEDAFQYVMDNVNFTPLNMKAEEGRLKKREFAEEVIFNDLFPHCKTHEQKKYFLGYMTHKLICAVLEINPADDRDSYVNKRIELSGILLNNLFRNYFNKLVKDMQKQIIKEINNGSWRSTDDFMNIITNTNIYKIVKSTTIENGLKRALATGDFGIKNANTTNNKVGVAQVLNRLTYISSLSHLRRVNTPIDKSGKLVAPRKLHNTSWGFLCPAETPEGASIGVVKNISYMTHITIPSNSIIIYEILEDKIINIDDKTPFQLYDKVKVIINGNWIGITEEPYELFLFLKEKKHAGILNIYTSIIFDYKNQEIKICNEAGRLTRPVLRVDNNKTILKESIIQKIDNKEIKWDDLLVNQKIPESVIEYIDPLEQNFSMIAMKPEQLNKKQDNMKYLYTHCEIHPSTIFGILASCISFPEHNQAPRVTYQCAMGKQAMGMYVTNFDNRMDKTSYVLSNPMRPLVDTRIMNLMNLNAIPSGEMAIVAIMSFSGYNQEDSIIFNEGSLKRGLFAATIYHTEKDEEKKIYGDEEMRCKPDQQKTKGMKFANYNKLKSNGLMAENALVENKDIIIGKVVPIKENKNDNTKVKKYNDQSIMYRTNEETYIDKNIIDRNGDGYNFCKVRLRNYRIPVIGDKFSSRHGQKGTVGIILPEEDMPFMSNGIKPDIIINPHAIPSRMTIGQLKETLLGKVLLELGLFGDGTSFNDLSVKTISHELLKLGYESHGNEILMNGMTGEQLETSVFIGPVFYQRLKHMVNDKQHSRSIGPMVGLTRQPAEGRARDGGLRFGEMERDATVANGMSRFTKGRMYDCSDKFKVYVCNQCGMNSAFNNEKGIHHCRSCDNYSNFSLVEIPYACKLLFQELMTMNVVPRIMTE